LRREATGTILTAVAAEKLGRLIVPDLSGEVCERLAAEVSAAHRSWEQSVALRRFARAAVETAVSEGEEAARTQLSGSGPF
jgi:hypothetical protein